MLNILTLMGAVEFKAAGSQIKTFAMFTNLI